MWVAQSTLTIILKLCACSYLHIFVAPDVINHQYLERRQSFLRASDQLYPLLWILVPNFLALHDQFLS